jgi:hypothetical protein
MASKQIDRGIHTDPVFLVVLGPLKVLNPFGITDLSSGSFRNRPA